MLSILNKAIEPSTSVADAITYLTAVKHLQSISGDCDPVVDKIKDLLSSSKTRLYGLVLLKIALEQNLDVYIKGNWNAVLFDILNDTTCSNLKQHACEVLCLLLPYMAKESQAHSAHANDLKKFYKDLFPLLLAEIDENVEWSKAALKCVYVCLKSFPHLLTVHKENLRDVMLKQMSYCVSSSFCEIIAECFAELPSVVRNPASYADEWKNQYTTILNSLYRFLNVFHTGEPLACTTKIEKREMYYVFPDDSSKEDMHQAFMKGARRYINLCKCLAKMLSTQSRHAVEIPIKRTLLFTTILFQVQDIKSVKPNNIEQQIFHSVLSQMQLASMAVLESLLLNFNVMPYSSAIAEVMESALIVSTKNIASEPISQIRLAVWKFLKIFIKKYGSSVSGDIVKLHDTVVQELLADISIEDKKSSQQSANQTLTRSKKNAANSCRKKGVDENMRIVCKEALETLEQLLYTGAHHFKRNEFQEIFTKLLQIACTVRVSYLNYPFPYDDGLCRKNLYSVLLALTLVSHLDFTELVQTAAGLLKNAFQDPCIEVKGFCNIAMALLSTKIHPQRPPPKYRVGDQRPSKVSSAIVKCAEWTSDNFIPNLPIENAPKAQTFRDPNEGVMVKDEHMEEGVAAMEEVVGTEAHYSENYVSECYMSKYPEQGSENLHNGDDILEIHHSSQGPDEESDEEDEEEEDERSYGEEEMNPGDTSSENMYIPSTSKLQVVNPVHINAETVPPSADQEYEQLRPCVKAETSSADSNKNMHLNGAHSTVPDTDAPSSSSSIQPSLANENGVYSYEEEDLEEDEGDEDEEEEATATFVPEKRTTNPYPPNPPSKKQKMDTEETLDDSVETLDEEAPRSPTLEEMKADFRCKEIIDDANS